MLEENDKFHRDFRKYALELIRATTSRNASLPPAIADVATDGMLNKIERASVVQNTNITFSDHELLLVIHRHLQSKGLLQSASVLARESRLQLDEVAVMARTSVRLKTPQKITPVPKSTLAATSANLELPSPLQTPTTKLPAGSSFRVQPRKKSIVHLKFDSAVPRASPPPGMTMSSVGEPAMEREGVKSWTQEASSSGLFHSSSSDRLPTVTLDYVIAEFLRNQHSHCQNPTSVLPPISILGRVLIDTEFLV
ncbi:hypothetical protein BC936DRAFT_143722 [Jimgerdemannia flammicorona]|uniref:Uncharacterized protein n=1 Tax=Jimgerdemannia flammicorona TaxID=994334 RepID=A0A432ZYI4_9FUNG|nr:hypothetical protein BC936DRAFT_143722 [Jimgerdemannia flammicorona]